MSLPSGQVATGLRVSPINGSFGALVETELSVSQILEDATLHTQLHQAWLEFGGVLVMRGLTDLTPQQMETIAGFFGEVERELDDSKKKCRVGDCLMRLGNTRNEAGELTALKADFSPLPADGSCQYNVDERVPVWHTDSTYRATPPIGSLLFCKQAPPEGAETCFADMRAAFDALDAQTQHRVKDLECFCSLAHHDAKVHSYSPDYPTLPPELRASNPPTRVPMVLEHPLTKRPALYGMNSSTCAVFHKGTAVSSERLDAYELQGVEDNSVQEEWRALMPEATSPQFTVMWRWRVGDLVAWDNRCTMHCGTGFDQNRYTREMWRATLIADKVHL
mmetsp:Transcript_46260/g.122736  ORF Transcript_46260/g.122736 Transcript_46260/m.122736 type:complete len:335 (-) Transcript_46260:145-1149(-)